MNRGSIAYFLQSVAAILAVLLVITSQFFTEASGQASHPIDRGTGMPRHDQVIVVIVILGSLLASQLVRERRRR